MTHPATQYALDVVAGEVIAGTLVRHTCQHQLEEALGAEDYLELGG